MQRIRAQFEDATKMTRRCSRPEGKLLHQRIALAGDELFKFGVKGRKLGVGMDVVARLVVSFVALVLPDVHCSASSVDKREIG